MPSWSIEVKRISPAPRSAASAAQAKSSRWVGRRPPWVVTTHGGKRPTDRELFAWAREAADRGAGEILFTSMDHDGTKNGYPCDTFARLAELPVPIIASGGAGTVDHIADVLTLGRADAALAASIFHYNEIPILVLKRELKKRNINVRL